MSRGKDKNTPRLRCKMEDLKGLADDYSYESDELDPSTLEGEVNEQGYLTKGNLESVAKWKSLRRAGLVKENDDKYVEEITQIALTAKNERTRIEVLTCLDGVRWPIASVVLHFFHKDRYPILDYRALWSVSMIKENSSTATPNRYCFDCWWEYVEFCRKTADTAGISMRQLDKALWKYSEKNSDKGKDKKK